MRPKLPRLTFFLLPSSFSLLALIFLWPLTLHPDFVPFQPRSSYSDLLISHLPNALYVRDSLTRFGQLPLWNAQLFAGQPFAADPLAGLWYPPNWLLVILPLPFGFNFLFWLHLAWAGWGMLRFLRAEGLSFGPALLGAVAFMGTPKLLAHLAAGHVSLVFAVAWTPWLMLALRGATGAGGWRRGAWAGAGLALIFLADVRWAFYAAILAAAWWVAALPPFAPRRERSGLSRAALAFALFFFLLSAGLLLPLAQFVLQSSRETLSLAEAATYSLPPLYLLGLLVPDPYGFAEYMTYLGLAPLLLALAGLGRRTVFWILAVIVAVAFSLGTNFILFPVLFRVLPGVGFLRVPPRAWFIVAFGVSVLAGHGAQRLAAIFSRRFPARAYLLPLLFAALTFFDLLRVVPQVLTVRPIPAPVAAAQWLAAQPGQFRVYSPSYSLPPGDGLQHADGVDPLQLAAFKTFFEQASGVPVTCYSVTLPPLGPCEPGTQTGLATFNVQAVPDARLLGRLNVKYVAAEFPLAVAGLRLAQTFGETRVYENLEAQPRAWVESEVARAAEVTEWTPDRLRVRAEGPGRLVLSEVNYVGWEAKVDGVSALSETVEGLLRGVRLKAGAHDVVFEFRPKWVYLGAGLTVVGLGLLFVQLVAKDGTLINADER